MKEVMGRRRLSQDEQLVWIRTRDELIRTDMAAYINDSDMTGSEALKASMEEHKNLWNFLDGQVVTAAEEELTTDEVMARAMQRAPQGAHSSTSAPPPPPR